MHTPFLWGAALVSIVIVSWFFYRFVVPESWRDWTRAGIVQAFHHLFLCRDVWIPRHALAKEQVDQAPT